MATLLKRRVRLLGPDSAGSRLTLRAFDHAEFEEGWRYELIDGVLVVSPFPLEQERDPNEELGRLLRNYREFNPQGTALDRTLPEQTLRTLRNRRRGDRVIWAGLGRRPKRFETPTIAVEFVSKGKRDQKRDYEEKRREYMQINVREYWVIDRFQRIMTVFSKHGKTFKKFIIRENQTYTTDLLPGFALSLSVLLQLADDWDESEDE